MRGRIEEASAGGGTAWTRSLNVCLMVAVGGVFLLGVAAVAILRLWSLAGCGAFVHFAVGSIEGRMFALEILVDVVPPVALLALPRVRRHRRGLYLTALLWWCSASSCTA